MAGVVRLVEIDQVVVSPDIQELEGGIERLAAAASAVDGGGDGTRAVQGLDVLGELFGDLHAPGLGAFGDLVADAPHDDAGMIAVAQHHRAEVALPPVGEVRVIVLRVGGLLALPLIEGLVHHQHAQAVARVEKRGRGRVVAGADGVEAVRLHQLDAALLGAIDRGGAEQAVVVVQAAALQLDALAVDAQAALRVHFHSADAERGGHGVRRLAASEQFDLGAVEPGSARGPQLRRGHVEDLLHAGGAAGGERLADVSRTDVRARRVEQANADDDVLGRRRAVLDLDRHLHRRAVLRDLWSGHAHAPQRHAHAPGGVQPHVAIDARARVPTAVAPLVADADGQDVLAVAAQVRRQVVGEGGVSVRMIAQQSAVDPDVAVHVDAVEDDLHLAPGRNGGRREALAIPARASHEPAGVAAPLAQFGIERTDPRRHHGRSPQRVFSVRIDGPWRKVLHAEIVRQVEGAPGGIVEVRELGSLRVAAEKAPSLVERLATLAGRDRALPGRRDLRRGARRAGQRRDGHRRDRLQRVPAVQSRGSVRTFGQFVVLHLSLQKGGRSAILF